MWGKRWSSSRILIKCDNLPVVNCVNKGYSKVPIMGDLLRVFMYNSMRYNILFRAEHVPGVDNKLADLLSRLLPQEFHRRATWTDPEPETLPPFSQRKSSTLHGEGMGGWYESCLQLRV